MFNSFSKTSFSIKLALVFLISSLLSPSSNAIRIVLSGGGLAEMMALRAIIQIPRTLKATHSHIDSLVFSSEQEIVIRKIIEEDFFLLDNYELEFHVPNSTADSIRYFKDNPFRVSIAHELLYKANEGPKSLVEITEIVFMTWINSPYTQQQLRSLGFKYKGWQDLIEKLYSSSFYNTETLYLDNSDSRLWINQLITRSGEIIDSSLVVELKDGSKNVTKYATSALNCHPESALKDLLFTGFYVTRAYIKGNVSWSCNNQKFKGTLILPMAQALNIEELKMNFKLVNLEMLGSECEEGLTQ